MSRDGTDGHDVDRARHGDRDALHRLLAKNEERIRRIIAARLTPELRARTRVSDILQSTFLQVLRSVATFRGDDEEQFGGWVVRIVENEIRDHFRYHNADKRRRMQTLLTEPVDARSNRGGALSPSGMHGRSDEFRSIQVALDGLKADHRTVLLLRLVDRKAHREIGEIMGRSEEAVRMLFGRARAAFMTEVARRQDRTID